MVRFLVFGFLVVMPLWALSFYNVKQSTLKLIWVEFIKRLLISVLAGFVLVIVFLAVVLATDFNNEFFFSYSMDSSSLKAGIQYQLLFPIFVKGLFGSTLIVLVVMLLRDLMLRILGKLKLR